MTVKPKCDCESSDGSPAKAALESLSISDADAGHSVEYSSSDVISESSDDVSVSSDEFESQKRSQAKTVETVTQKESVHAVFYSWKYVSYPSSQTIASDSQT